jgi:hypothetical protein
MTGRNVCALSFFLVKSTQLIFDYSELEKLFSQIRPKFGVFAKSLRVSFLAFQVPQPPMLGGLKA